ncbi:MAG: efflux RND transporter periplasmic adaptor subunit [Fibrobacteria bacterium]
MSLFKGKSLLVVIAVVILAGLGAYWIWGGKPAEIKWRTAAVEKGPLQVSVTATGTLQAVLTVQVGTQVSGTVSALYVDFNSQVKKNQIIARIDTTLLRAALSDANSNVEKVAAQNLQAASERKRSQALFSGGLISQSDLDAAVANADVAAANLASARAQVDRARINLRYATIVSPIDGIVLSRAVDVGQTVAASFNTPTLFTIAGDLRQMQVQASVDEADIGKVSLGQRATFTVDAYPDSVFIGQVEQIRLQPVTVQNVVSYDVVISVPNPQLKLMPGMTASLTIVIARKEDVLQVPAAALRFNPFEGMGVKGKKGGKDGKRPGKSAPSDSAGGRMAGGAGLMDSNANSAHRWGGKEGKGRRGEGSGRVFILENGKPRPVHVQAGLTDGTHTEITGDLEAGVEVITGVEAPKAGDAPAASPFGMPRGGGRGSSGGRAH